MLRDLRHALRQLRRSPGFAVAVVLILGLGIGATTTIFTLVHAVILRPLDYPEADRIVTLWSFSPQRSDRYTVSGPDYRDWRDQSRSFAPLACYRFGGTEAVVIAGVAENVETAAVSGGFFEVLGVAPRAGRVFSVDEQRTGGVVLIGHALVQRHFRGDDKQAVGATVKVFGQPFRIIGVMPPGVRFPQRTEVWLPVDTIIPPAVSRTAHNYYVVGRLAPGTSLASARAEMEAIAARLAQQYPESNRNKGAAVMPLQALLVSEYRSTLWLLMGAVGLVLAIACANVAALLLARGARRTREIAVRVALGARRGHIARQLLTETLVLAALGGAVGLLAASWGLEALLALLPRRIPGLERAGVDGTVVAFATAVSLAVCLCAGLFPAVQAARADVHAAMQAGAPPIASSRARLQSALVVAQLALSFALLVGAAVVLQSLQRLAAVDPGYRRENLLVLEANYSGVSETDGRRALAFFERLRDLAARLPGVSAAGYGQTLPTERAGSNGTYWIDGRPDRGNALFRAVGPDYFSLLGIPVRAGREIDRRDTTEGPRVVVINQSMARASWPDRSPLGERVRFGWMRSTEAWMTIVGVVADTRTAPDQPIRQEVFVPAAQHPRTALSLKILARTAIEPLALMESLRDQARSLDPEVPVVLTTAEHIATRYLSAPRFRTVLLALFATMALLLAAVGVAGLMACAVAARRREIGVRLAVGATPGSILRGVLWRSVRLTLVGLALGLLAAMAMDRLLEGLLFGVTPTDPRTLLLVGVTLMLAALAATAWPALTAARQSPMTALRAE